MLIDVRDTDYGYMGFIPNSVNIDSSHFMDDDEVDRMIQVS